MDTTLNTALNLANQGIKVYPLSAGSKAPLKGSHGEQDATTNQDQIKEWFDDSNYNLAINLKESCLAVVDLDNHGTVNGIKGWSKYLLNHGNDEMDSLKTYMENTPQNGIHIFSHFNGQADNEDMDLTPGVELLTGKAIVAPSYIDEYQRAYAPQMSGFPNLDTSQLLDLPQFVLDLARETQRKKNSQPTTLFNYAQTQKRWTGSLLDDIVHGTGQGNRNIFLTKLTGKLFWSGADTDSIYDMLMYANSNCEPPLPENEVNSIFGSILKKNGGM